MNLKSEGKRKHSAIIIGCGGQGCMADAPGSENSEKIISFAHAFAEHEGFFIFGFIDKDKEKANDATKIWGGNIYSSIKNAFDVAKMEIYGPIDVAVVTTPDDHHYEILKELTDYPLRLVICEKPICNDLEQAREIVALYRAKGIPLMVNYTRNYLPYYENLKQRYESGEFGKIVSANVVFNRGWEHTATHAISFLEWFFNSQYNGKIMECETDYRIWQIDLYFEKYHWREERIGDMPVWDYCDKQTWYVVDNAYNFLEGKEPLKCTGEDGLNALEICYELMEGTR